MAIEEVIVVALAVARFVIVLKMQCLCRRRVLFFLYEGAGRELLSRHDRWSRHVRPMMPSSRDARCLSCAGAAPLDRITQPTNLCRPTSPPLLMRHQRHGHHERLLLRPRDHDHLCLVLLLLVLPAAAVAPPATTSSAAVRGAQPHARRTSPRVVCRVVLTKYGRSSGGSCCSHSQR